MTDLLIRTLARRPVGTLARPSAVLAYAIALAYGGGVWLTALHHLEGGHEAGEPPFLVHCLRDATLALPVVFLAAWLGIVLARNVVGAARAERRPVLAGAALAATVALTVSAAVACMSPMHETLFHAHHGGPELPLPLHFARDALLALLVNLPASAAVTAALLRRRDARPWATPQVDRWTAARRTRRQRAALPGALALFVAAPALIFAQSGAAIATADAGPGTPCPGGAPTRTYDVQAIDVDIPLNRFGDHDPAGKMYVLSKDVDAVRKQEASRHVSIGLRDDAIQPLVVRANEGDCVEVSFTNNASGGDYGFHVDGLAYDLASSGDAIGNNPSSAVPRGQTRVYRYYVPKTPELEGAHYVRPGPGNRFAVQHGLFGSIAVEPEGSTWSDMITGGPIDSGWQATVKPDGNKAFREYVQLYHEVGDEKYDILDASGHKLPRVDPHTESYRPGARAMNYRSEPFMDRLNHAPKEEAHGYSSYTFGDPATPMPRGYQGDPTKMRILHAGSEMFHVFHMHGGGIRWRFNPHADHTYDYADTGLNKAPKTQSSPSARLDSQAFGPGESYDLEIEGGAGGVQQGAGEFLFHCHIAEHYISGMWSFWRVYDTLQPDLKPLSDRTALPKAVSSAELIGKTMPDGTTLTKDNLDQWIRPQLPPQGVPQDSQDASVMNWKLDTSDASKPLYLGEPEDKSDYPNLTNEQDTTGRLDGHPGLFANDVPVGADSRPEIRFNPDNGRPAYPLLRTHVGKRPPFSPNGHSGAPWLGESGDHTKATSDAVDPWANRNDAICPKGAPLRRFNVVALELPIQVTKTTKDPTGMIYVLAKDVDDVLAGRKPAQPLAIRGNIGDCIGVTLTSRLTDKGAFGGFAKVNMHIHHVQFDTQASDGVITGLSYEQAVRPFAAEDPSLTAAASNGDDVVHLSSVAKFVPGVSIAVGEGTEAIEIRRIESVDAAAGTVKLAAPLDKDHARGDAAGTEFVQYRWYPDVALDNIFWHDHVDGIHGWGHGLVGQFIVEPKGSTYHDPTTGEQVDSGTFVDVHTNNPLADGFVDGSFRELALWTLDENPVTDSTINLRAEPWADRLAKNDPSLLFSSYTHGDPITPLPRAYARDPFVIRTINVGPSVDTFHLDGHRFFLENRYTDAKTGQVESTPTDTVHYGISERYTAILAGGAGGPQGRPGDFLYMNGLGRRFRQGAWGLMRVLPRQVANLQPLPGTDVPAGGGALPAQTGGRPPESSDPGDPCPSGAPQRNLAVSAVDLPNKQEGVAAAFVPSTDATAIQAGQKAAEPLVVHAAAGECLTVTLKNARKGERASFHLDELLRTQESSGVDVGYNPEQTVAPGGSRTYRFYADTDKIGSALISDLGGNDTGTQGMYGAVVVAPAKAAFTDPVTGAPTQLGTQVDVHVPGRGGYRDFTVALSDNDPIIGGSFMPYPIGVKGQSLVNYRSAPRPDDANAFSSKVHGDPQTPLLRAYGGDPIQVHALVAPGSEQLHTFSLGGQSWHIDPHVTSSNEVSTQGIGAWEAMDFEPIGGAGGRQRSVGDWFYGDLRRPFSEAGMWGLMRVMSDASCPIKPLDGLRCVAQGPVPVGNAAGAGTTPSDPGAPSSPAAAGEPGPASAPETPARSGSSAGAPSTAAGTAPGSATGGEARPSVRSPRARLHGLQLRPRTLRRSALARRGVRFTVIAPDDTRAVEVAVGPARRSGGLRVLARRALRVGRGGVVRATLRVDRRTLRRMKAGRYVVRVRAGRSAKALDTATAAVLTLRR